MVCVERHTLPTTHTRGSLRRELPQTKRVKTCTLGNLPCAMLPIAHRSVSRGLTWSLTYLPLGPANLFVALICFSRPGKGAECPERKKKLYPLALRIISKVVPLVWLSLMAHSLAQSSPWRATALTSSAICFYPCFRLRRSASHRHMSIHVETNVHAIMALTNACARVCESA